jgi:hypothetical protein
MAKASATANGKIFTIYAPIAYMSAIRNGTDFTPIGAVIGLSYRATRDGKGVEDFGPIRSAVETSAKKSVGFQLIEAARELFNADYDAMRAEVDRAYAAGESRWPQSEIIERAKI